MFTNFGDEKFSLSFGKSALNRFAFSGWFCFPSHLLNLAEKNNNQFYVDMVASRHIIQIAPVSIWHKIQLFPKYHWFTWSKNETTCHLHHFLHPLALPKIQSVFSKIYYPRQILPIFPKSFLISAQNPQFR